jgi:hypothetical protein
MDDRAVRRCHGVMHLASPLFSTQSQAEGRTERAPRRHKRRIEEFCGDPERACAVIFVRPLASVGADF